MNHNSFRYGATLQQTYKYMLETICNGSNLQRTNITVQIRYILLYTLYYICKTRKPIYYIPMTIDVLEDSNHIYCNQS